MTADDYLAGRLWDDAICYSFYPIDLHTDTGGGLEKRYLDPGVVPTIPRRAVVPRGLSRIAVAGRCVSSDREANSAMRVQASSMAMGQAAAALAAVAADCDADFRDADLNATRRLLAQHDAIVP